LNRGYAHAGVITLSRREIGERLLEVGRRHFLAYRIEGRFFEHAIGLA
jgi:hypothetical protein